MWHARGAEPQQLYVTRGADMVVGRLGLLPEGSRGDRKISRRHARLLVTDTEVCVFDLGSANGTLVNGRRVTSRRLRHGDLLQLGDAAAEIHIESLAQRAEG